MSAIRTVRDAAYLFGITVIRGRGGVTGRLREWLATWRLYRRSYYTTATDEHLTLVALWHWGLERERGESDHRLKGRCAAVLRDMQGTR